MHTFFSNIRKNIDFNYILDSLGLLLIGFFSLGYFLFQRQFAEVNIQFTFFNFPVFMGEILLALCLVLFLVKTVVNLRKFSLNLRPFPVFLRDNRFYLFISLYFLFVLFKAFYGYSKWGPLAFRHAALFYYPLFAIFGFYFYRRKFFSNKKSILLVLLLIFIPKLFVFYDYALLTSFILTFIIIRANSHKYIRYLLFFLLSILTPYRLIIDTSRTMLVANTAAILYIAGILFLTLQIKRKFKLAVSLFLFIALVAGIAKIADKNSLQSMFDFKQFVNSYKNTKRIISEKEKKFKMQEIRKTRLYNPGQVLFFKEPATVKEPSPDIVGGIGELLSASKTLTKKIEEVSSDIAGEVAKPKQIEFVPFAIKDIKAGSKTLTKKIEDISSDIAGEESSSKQTKSVPFAVKDIKVVSEILTQKIEALFRAYQVKPQTPVKMQVPVKPTGRSLEAAVTNSLFRIFIWEDLIADLRQEKPLMGFDFGKPFRSKKIEMLYWADKDWLTDGWITAHNSYLEIIYRTGIIGILFILSILFLLFKMIKRSLSLKSVNGVLLCAILINWLVAANFLVILELPYNAIPFWSLFGMTFAYLKKKANNLSRQ